MSNSSYNTYREWKNWNNSSKIPDWLGRYFEKELGVASSEPMKSVLEIGFGNGELLRWAKSQGMEVAGAEIIPELVDALKKDGFDVALWDASVGDNSGCPWAGEKFDCIILFDVIEHLTLDQATQALNNLAALLHPGGRIICRFPNGESPVSSLIFNNDFTHQTLFTARKLEHLCLETPLKLVRYGNSARVVNMSVLFPFKWLCFLLRDLCEILFGYIYYSHRVPLDQCATAVFRLKRSVNN